MKKILNFIIRFLIIALICFGALYIFNTRGYDYKLNMTKEPVINELTTIEIETTNNGDNYNAFNVNLEIYNKYNKNETYTFEAVPSFQTGKYLVAFTPQFSGTYISNLLVTPKEGENPLAYQFEFVVK